MVNAGRTQADNNRDINIFGIISMYTDEKFLSKSWKIFILVLLNALFCALPHIRARRYAPIGKVQDMEIMDSLFSRYRSSSTELVSYTVSAEEERRMSIVFIKNEDCVMCWYLCGEAGKQKLSRIWANKKVAQGDYSVIFDYRFKDLCGVTKSETGLAFVPPLNLQKITVYKSRKKSFYFENEKAPASYTPNAKKEKYRKEWSGIISRAVKSLQTEKDTDDGNKGY